MNNQKSVISNVGMLLATVIWGSTYIIANSNMKCNLFSYPNNIEFSI